MTYDIVVLESFEEPGKSDNDIVIAVREVPDEIRELRERWFDSGGMVSPEGLCP